MTLYSKILLLVVSVFILSACQKKADMSVPAERYENIKIGLVKFTQPRTTSALITGKLPMGQGFIDKGELKDLDKYLQFELRKTSLPFAVIPISDEMNKLDFHESQNPQALKKWVEFGKMNNLNMLIVPQIINWHDREGSNAGVDSAAHIRLELYILDIKNERIFDIAFFEEQQVGLIDNIFNVGSFLKRKGSWITADEMAKEAITATVKELKL